MSILGPDTNPEPESVANVDPKVTPPGPLDFINTESGVDNRPGVRLRESGRGSTQERPPVVNPVPFPEELRRPHPKVKLPVDQ